MSALAVAFAAPASSATQKAKAPTVKQAAAAYLAAVAPFNATEDQVNARVATWTANTPAAQEAADLAPVLAAYKKFDAFLSSYRWPAVAKTDAQRLLQNDAVSIADYSKIGKVSAASMQATLQTDGAADSAAVKLIRQDLKLPGATAPGTTTPTASKGHVGATINLSGSSGASADVTLTQIIDPAQGGDQYTTPDDGKRFVGAVMTIKNVGTSAFTGDAASNSTIMGSDGQIYTPDFNSLAGCTDFDNGQYQLGAGESATGCVAFQIPNGVTVVKFKFNPDAGYASDFGEWAVP
jgi:hypothetical protein